MKLEETILKMREENSDERFYPLIEGMKRRAEKGLLEGISAKSIDDCIKKIEKDQIHKEQVAINLKQEIFELNEAINKFGYLAEEKTNEVLDESVTFIDNAGNLKTMLTPDYVKDQHEYHTETQIENYKKRKKIRDYKMISEEINIDSLKKFSEMSFEEILNEDISLKEDIDINVLDEAISILVDEFEDHETLINEGAWKEKKLNKKISKEKMEEDAIYLSKWKWMKFSLRFLEESSIDEILEAYQTKHNSQFNIKEMNKKEKIKKLMRILNEFSNEEKLFMIKNIQIPYDDIAKKINVNGFRTIEHHQSSVESSSTSAAFSGITVPYSAIIGFGGLAEAGAKIALTGGIVAASIFALITLGFTINAIYHARQIKGKFRMENKEKIISFIKEKYKDTDPSKTAKEKIAKEIIHNLKINGHRRDTLWEVTINFKALRYKKDKILFAYGRVETKASKKYPITMPFEFDGHILKFNPNVSYEHQEGMFPYSSSLDMRDASLDKSYSLFIGVSIFDENGNFLRDKIIKKHEKK